MSFQHTGSVNRSASLTRIFSRSTLAAAIGLAFSANAFAGFPTLYGKISITAGQFDFEKNDFAAVTPATNPVSFKHTGAKGVATELDTFSVESNGSRLGVQGDFDAAAGLNVFYRVEYGVDVDNGTNNANGRELVQRNIFGGLRGSWGALLAGKNDTPLRSLAGRNGTIVKNEFIPAVQRTDIDRFNEAPLGDIGTYLVGENRVDNVIQYTFPILLGGLEINLAAIQAEETGVKTRTNNVVTNTSEQDDNKFASGQSVSIGYGKTGWFIGAAYESNVANSDTLRALGEVTVGPVKLGAIYQTAERHDELDSLGGLGTFVSVNGTSRGAQNGLNPLGEWDGIANTTTNNGYKEQDAYVLNAAWKIAGPWVAKVQFANSTSTPTAAYADVELDAITAGLDYNLNDSTRVFGYYSSVEAQGDKAINTSSTTDKIAAVGLDFRF